jgi:hypothetical protein
MLNSDTLLLAQMQSDYYDLCGQLATTLFERAKISLGSNEKGCNGYARAVTNAPDTDAQIEYIWTLVADQPDPVFGVRAVRVVESPTSIDVKTRILVTTEDYFEMITYMRECLTTPDNALFYIWIM